MNRKKLLSSIVVAASLFLTACVSHLPESRFEQQIDEVRPAIVGIVAEKIDPFFMRSETGLGTGFFVERNLIITNYHVVDNATKISVITNNVGKTFPATVVAYDKTIDLAALRIDEWQPFADVAKWGTLDFAKEWRIGQDVWIFGHPGILYTVGTGIIAGGYNRGQGPSDPSLLVPITAPIRHGNSGGPVLDSNNKVVGVAVQVYIDLFNGQPSGAGSLGEMIPLEMVQKAVKSFRAHKPVSWPVLGLMLKNNLDGDGLGVIVAKADYKGSGWWSGIRDNDVVLGVRAEGGPYVATNEVETFKQQMDLRLLGDNITVTVRRGTETLDIPVKLTLEANVTIDEDTETEEKPTIPRPPLTPVS